MQGVADASPLGGEDTWFGIFVPRATPQAFVSRINSEVARIIKTPDTQERLVTLGAEGQLRGPVPEHAGGRAGGLGAGSIKQFGMVAAC